MSDIAGSLRDALLAGDATRSLIVGVLVAAALVLVLAGVIVLLRSEGSERRLDSLLSQAAGRETRGSWLARLLAVGLIVAALWGARSYTQRPSECDRCHTDRAQAAALAETRHRSVGCMSCHGERGVGGGLRQLVSYARWIEVYTRTRKVPEARGDSVDMRACLACHSDIRPTRVTRGGIRVRHSDFLDAGRVCNDCHASVAHPGAVPRPTKPTMPACVPCHNAAKASAECQVCHVRGVELTALEDSGFPKVQISEQRERSACYGCHQERTCTSCHGVRMPHPEGWVLSKDSGTNLHVRQGFASRELCFRCHFKDKQVFVGSDESCKCHGLMGRMHGGAPWVREHGLQATGVKTGTRAACFECHSNSLCGDCHPASYTDRYAPRVGSDDYPRDIQPRPEDVDF
jgi:hypothetical protein